MCGIFVAIGKNDGEKLSVYSKRMSHRGPNERGVKVFGNNTLIHERLSIIDLDTGIQPIKGSGEVWMVHNGEIYNHQELRDTVLKDVKISSKSDSAVIVHLYEKFGKDMMPHLDGDFAFVVVEEDGNFIAGRDPIGVKPLYYGKDKEGHYYFSSEMKAIADLCEEMSAFPPGYIFTPKGGFERYFNPVWLDDKTSTRDIDYTSLRKSLEDSVEKRLMTDVPLGVLLSGGLDSSLISAITARKLKARNKELHSFSVGFSEDAPDLVAAREVAKHIGTKHNEIIYTIEEGISAIEKIIWHTESYDVTTVRASTPMYFLSKDISSKGIKVVLSGEGADEIFGGYLYFHNAPNAGEFQKELVSRVQRLSTADCLRADKSTMAWGIEARVPFLDRDFLMESMTLKPDVKMSNHYKGVEKYILRKAFDDKEKPYIPESVLWRQKEQFSDGVGYTWIDTLISYCTSQVSDAEFAQAEKLFPYNTPTTKEAFFYRRIFEKHFPQKTAIETVLRWIPKWQTNQDPSGRANKSHVQADVNIAKNE